MQKGIVWSRDGGSTSVIFFLFPIMFNSKNSVFNQYIITFADNSSVEPTIFFIEKISFSLKLFSGHFYGQSFIKTVRGPLLSNK